jgi:3',5'-cyclic AMP phosphodiesterase CpdA
MSGVRLVHLSDVHFGGHADLAQIAALDRLIPELAPGAVVISGDLSQRARHGEFQRALAFVEQCRRTAPVVTVPGNHDVRWWSSPFGFRGEGPKYRHYRRYLGEDTGPVLEVPGAVIVGTVSANGLAFGSVTWNPRDLTVKGHLPASELERARVTFSRVSPADCRVLVLHHNVIRGKISNRWGLSRPEATQRAIIESGADLVLCGHDHEEQIALLGRKDGRTEGRTVVVSQSGTHTDMTRGKRPSVFNLIWIAPEEIGVRYMRWNGLSFEPAGEENFARQRRG